MKYLNMIHLYLLQQIIMSNDRFKKVREKYMNPTHKLEIVTAHEVKECNPDQPVLRINNSERDFTIGQPCQWSITTDDVYNTQNSYQQNQQQRY